MLMSDFCINPNTIPAINPYVNGAPNIRPDKSLKTIQSRLSTPLFLSLTTLVRAARNRSGACDNLVIQVCVKPLVLSSYWPYKLYAHMHLGNVHQFLIYVCYFAGCAGNVALSCTWATNTGTTMTQETHLNHLNVCGNGRTGKSWRNILCNLDNDNTPVWLSILYIRKHTHKNKKCRSWRGGLHTHIHTTCMFCFCTYI